jgi:PAS domain S-box-containing protein
MSDEVEPSGRPVPGDGDSAEEPVVGADRAAEAPIRVLHVDDDETIRRLVDRYLSRFGMTVVSESDPAAAVDHLADATLDCVVSDYDMPGSDGLELLSTVRERRPEFPFVLFTGKGSEEIASEAIGAGVTDYVRKRGGAETYEMLAKRIENAVGSYRAERARRRSERRFDTLFETVPDAVLDLDESGVVRRANPATERVLGRAPETLVGEPVTSLLPPDRRDTYAERFENYVEGGQRALAWTDTVVDAMVDGERRPVSVSLGERRVGDDRRITAVVRDVTDRQERERRLRTAKRRYRRLVEANVVGVYTIRDRVLEYVNPHLADLLGYEPEELVGESVMTVIPEAERDRVTERLRAREVGDTETVEYTLRMERKDGEQITTRVEGARVDTADGQAIVGVVRDVTERERARRELQASRDRIAALHDAAVEVAAADSVGAVAERTVAAAEEVLEMDRSAVDVVDDAGERLRTLAVSEAVDSEGYHGEIAVDSADSLAAETYRTGESRLITDVHGTEYDAAAETYRSGVSVPIGDRGVFQAVAAEPDAFDEEDRRTAELLAAHAASALDRLDSRDQLREQKERLKRQNERLETFASVVSHDLRNPIEVARANVELAKRGDEDALADTERALDRMDELVGDVLELARGADGVDSMPVALGPVVREAWESVHDETATLSVTDEDTVISADRGQLKRLLENLLSNSVEHAGDGVAVRVGPIDDGDGDGVGGFYVADDGEGVADERRGAVFEPGVTEDDAGTGLGLAIVEEIAAAHDWSVHLSSSREGGVRVEVTGVEPV